MPTLRPLSRGASLVVGSFLDRRWRGQLDYRAMLFALTQIRNLMGVLGDTSNETLFGAMFSGLLGGFAG